MHDPANELLRIHLPRTPVNRATATPTKSRLPRPRLECKLVECQPARWCQSMERERRTQNPPSGSVTEVITRDIVPGREHEFEFANEEALVAWEASEERDRLVQEARKFSTPDVQRATGLETWFVLPGQRAIVPPPRWKMLLVTLIGAYPLVVLIVRRQPRVVEPHRRRLLHELLPLLRPAGMPGLHDAREVAEVHLQLREIGSASVVRQGFGLETRLVLSKVPT